MRAQAFADEIHARARNQPAAVLQNHKITLRDFISGLSDNSLLTG